MKSKTPFHAAAGQFVSSLDGSRNIFSQLTDLFSALAWQDFTNDWAPDYAERCFKFNRAQKKFQKDIRDWADSITEDDLNLVRRIFGGYRQAEISGQGGGQHRTHSQKARIASGKKTVRRKAAARQGVCKKRS